MHFVTLASSEGTSLGPAASVRSCRAVAVHHLVCLFMFWVRKQSNTMTIYSEQKPTPSPPNPPALCFLFKMRSMELHLCFLRDPLCFSLYRCCCFSGHITLVSISPVLALQPLMNHESKVSVALFSLKAS